MPTLKAALLAHERENMVVGAQTATRERFKALARPHFARSASTPTPL